MAKPEKRWSAFGIGLRGANYLSARTVCVNYCGVSLSVRAGFGIQWSNKSLGIAQNLFTNFWASL